MGMLADLLSCSPCTVLPGNGFSVVPKSRTRLILSERRDEGTVAMHYGELDECDYLAAEECLPTLPNTVSSLLLFFEFLYWSWH